MCSFGRLGTNFSYLTRTVCLSGCCDCCDSDVHWSAFDRECSAHLPAYARPAFIRLTAAIALTSTFKHQKNGLVKDGYALDSMGADKLYYYNAREHRVVKMTPELERKINTGEIQL